jgi:hypothetical protein
MMKFFALFLIVSTAHAYVPTVESLFRHGSNPDIVANGMVVTMVVKKIQPGEKVNESVNNASLLKDEKAEDFFKIFFTKTGDHLKVAQTRYNAATFSEASLEHKIYYPNFNAFTMKPSIEQAEKGIFLGLLDSLMLNNGSHLVNYLKSLGVPVKLNNEIINREKVEFLADYKRYLITVSKDRNARKTEVNPMRPDDASARQRADEIMGEPMYVDSKQVRISKDEGVIAWVVNAGPFEAVVSYKERDIQRIKYKSAAGDFEIICKDYWLANGSHALPRFMLIKTFSGVNYQVEITNLRHYLEKEDDLIKRLKNWDQVLKGRESSEPRPEFLL